MADLFGVSGLFTEFEKDRSAGDEILKKSYDGNTSKPTKCRTNAGMPDADEVRLNSDNKRMDHAQGNETYESCRSTDSADGRSAGANLEYIKKLEDEVGRLKSINILLNERIIDGGFVERC
jgi:hypothetical protein